MSSLKIAVTTDTHMGHHFKTILKIEKMLKKLMTEKFDILIHCGDWVSSKQRQLETSFKLFRKIIPKEIPILAVIGNHDFWNGDEKFKNSSLMLENHNRLFQEYDIHYLENGPFIFQNVGFYGFNGWYHSTRPATNDTRWMPRFFEGLDPHVYFNNIARKKAFELLNLELLYEKNVLVTHFPFFTDHIKYAEFCADMNYMDPFTEKFDLMLVGHSHKECDWVKNKCRVVNAGSDYNFPRYKIVDL